MLRKRREHRGKNNHQSIEDGSQQEQLRFVRRGCEKRRMNEARAARRPLAKRALGKRI